MYIAYNNILERQALFYFVESTDRIISSFLLGLFGNPLSQDYDYRMYVLFCISSLEILDRQGMFLTSIGIWQSGILKK